MTPRSINIFLFDGDPNGIRVAQVSMSTIQAIAFRRNQLSRVCSTFPELERPGVYVLIGLDENRHGRQLAYIGESESVAARLAYHNSREVGRGEKSYWDETVVFLSKDETLTKSHARYVEACLIGDIGVNPHWRMPNAKRPSDYACKLPLQDRTAMDEFVDQAKTLLGALGWDVFRDMRWRARSSSAVWWDEAASGMEPPRFRFRGRGFDAEMTIGRLGEFLVLAGSRARLRTTVTVPRSTTTLRTTLIEAGVLRVDGDALLFANHYTFPSPSAAAAVVLGASANGRLLWRLSDGTTYAGWEAAASAPSSRMAPR